MAGKKKQEESAGAPAWVMTFADLMSLLMCFFVLLLSFSEMDRKKYKQVAGSMAQAFGVQREVPTLESPKGVTVIAKEFAPGKPQPTLERVLKQETTDDTQDYLEVLEAIDRVQEISFGEERGLMKGNVDEDVNVDGEFAGGQAQGAGNENLAGMGVDGEAGPGSGKSQADVSAEAKAMEEALQQALNDAKKQAEALKEALKDEVEQELVRIDAKDQGVLIKVREQGSFPSAQSTLKKSFLPVLRKISDALISETSDLVVGGHTDDIPISTARFPSNWELSAARASSVLQAFITEKLVSQDRLELRAYADTEPLVPNTSSANRGINRRVEIFINTMPDIADKAATRAVLEISSTSMMNERMPAGEYDL